MKDSSLQVSAGDWLVCVHGGEQWPLLFTPLTHYRRLDAFTTVSDRALPSAWGKGACHVEEGRGGGAYSYGQPGMQRFGHCALNSIKGM